MHAHTFIHSLADTLNDYVSNMDGRARKRDMISTTTETANTDDDDVEMSP